MNNYDLSTVNFYGDRLLGVMDRQAKEIFVPIKPICSNLGLDFPSQYKRINNHRILSEGIVKMTIPSQGGDQETFCLRHDLFPLWLVTVEVSRVKKEKQDRLYLYQKEAAKVLAEHFFGKKETIEENGQYLLIPHIDSNVSIPVDQRLEKLSHIINSIKKLKGFSDHEIKAMVIYYHKLLKLPIDFIVSHKLVGTSNVKLLEGGKQ